MTQERLPNFLIIGAMRSGTTSLARYLGAHPNVFMAPQKEIHFFDANYEKGIDWYRRQFSGVTTERAIGEATPSYLYDRSSIERIAAMLPQVLLVAILRNPVDRAYSAYWLNRALGRETLGFEEALEAERLRLYSTDPRTRFRRSYLDRGRYLRQLESVCQHFPREALQVLIFEEMRDRPADVYGCACRFLGVDDSIVPAIVGRPLNRFVTFRSRAARDIARHFPRIVERGIRRLNVRGRQPYQPMDPLLRAELIERFRDDNAALSVWLGRDLSVWDS